MSERVVFAIPGDLDTPSGGYAYDRRLIAELDRLGRPVRHLSLPPGYPRPSEAEARACEAMLADLADDTLVLVDGLAFGAMAGIAARHGARLRLAALVHHPLALETGLTRDEAHAFEASERDALSRAKAVIVTSDATKRTLEADFGVEARIVSVAPPGTDRPDPRTGRKAGAGAEGRGEGRAGDVPTILSVGSLIPRKDHATLVDALARLRDRPWRARIVGSARADPATAASLAHRIAAHGLGARIELAGAVDGIEAEYAGADLFALASRYEGYGMVFAEALVRGLPIVACESPAVAALVPREAGALVAPGDPDGLAAALARLLDDADARSRAGEAARAAGEALPGWADTAAIVDGALTRLSDSRTVREAVS